jgi:hypothetical protein
MISGKLRINSIPAAEEQEEEGAEAISYMWV